MGKWSSITRYPDIRQSGYTHLTHNERPLSAAKSAKLLAMRAAHSMVRSRDLAPGRRIFCGAEVAAELRSSRAWGWPGGDHESSSVGEDESLLAPDVAERLWSTLETVGLSAREASA